MIPVLLAALPARAADVPARDIRDVLAVQHVVLDAPERAGMLPERPEWREGWFVTVRVSPERASLGQGLAPLLWIGDQPVSRFNADPVGGCLVVLVEGPVDLATAPVFFGPAELAERVQPAQAAERVAAAVAAGATPFAKARLAAVTLPEVRLPHGGALPAAAQARVAACMP
jgi:hypothetical protein